MIDLEERLTFYRPTEVADGFGGVVAGWNAEFTTRAHVRFLRGGETVQASRLAGRQPVVLTVRASVAVASVTPAWRAQARDGTDYNLRAIVPTEDRMFYEMTAESGVEV